MDKATHGLRLKAAMANAGMSRKDVAELVGVNERTVTNWTSGTTWPDDIDRANLRKKFPNYDDPGDAVEVAVRASELTEDRQYVVIATYKRLIREQAEGVTA